MTELDLAPSRLVQDPEPEAVPAGGGIDAVVAARVALPIVVLGAFLAAVWSFERFRGGVSDVAPYLPALLYGAVGLLLAISALRKLPAARRLEPVVERLGRLRTFVLPAALTGAVLAYLAPVIDSWEAGRRGGSMLAGVVPFSDAHEYFTGAQHLIFEGGLDDWNSRRPMNASFLAFRLVVTDLDLRWALIIQAALLGVACFLAARAVARDLGLAAGMVLFAGIYGTASFGVETTLSESLGVTLGALAFAALWHAVRDRSHWLAVVGLFVLTLAIDARAGTFLILVVLPIWFARHLRRGSERLNRQTLGAGLAAVVIGVVLNAGLVVLLGGAPGNINGNVYYTLYGLAKGNQGWEQFRVDYPKSTRLPDAEQTALVRRKFFEQLGRDPGQFVVGLGRSGRDYLEYADRQILPPTKMSSTARGVVAGLAVLLGALLLAVRWRSSGWRHAALDLALFGGVIVAVPALFGVWGVDLVLRYPTWLALMVVGGGFVAYLGLGTARLASPLRSYMAVSAAAIALSVPFVPLIDAGTRVFAATLPFFALPIVGAVALLDRALARAEAKDPAKRARIPQRTWWPVAVSGGIAVATFVGAPLVAVAAGHPKASVRTCPSGDKEFTFTGGVAAHLVAPDTPQASIEDSDLAAFPATAGAVGTSIEKLSPGTTLFAGFLLDRNRLEPQVIAIDGVVEPPGRDQLMLCGRVRRDPATGVRILFARPLR